MFAILFGVVSLVLVAGLVITLVAVFKIRKVIKSNQSEDRSFSDNPNAAYGVLNASKFSYTYYITGLKVDFSSVLKAFYTDIFL